MADDKKKEKPKPAGWNFDPIEGFVVLLFFLALIGGGVPAILRFFTSGDLTFFGVKISSIFEFFASKAQLFKILGYGVAGGAAIGSFSYTKMGDGIWRQMKANVYPENMPKVSSASAPVPEEVNSKWVKIVKLSESQNPSDWRLSIIEADIMLDDLLNKLKLPGDTMGDKLKAVEQSDFTTIESAWEAHKFRNNIAHEGNDFLVNQREIRRIISLYEAVFKEFSII